MTKLMSVLNETRVIPPIFDFLTAAFQKTLFFSRSGSFPSRAHLEKQDRFRRPWPCDLQDFDGRKQSFWISLSAYRAKPNDSRSPIALS